MKLETIIELQKEFKEKVNTMTGQELFEYSMQPETRNVLHAIYDRLYHKKIKGCDNCYADAILIISSIDKNTLMEKMKCLYALRAGFISQDKFTGTVAHFSDELTKVDNLLSNHTITNDLAEYHLAINPGIETMFTMLPEDWQARAEAARVKWFGKPEEKPVEKVVVIPPVEAEVDQVKENEVAGIVIDPETMNNTTEQEKNPEPVKEPEPIKKSDPEPKKEKAPKAPKKTAKKKTAKRKK
jgi:hypothetical protein